MRRWAQGVWLAGALFAGAPGAHALSISPSVVETRASAGESARGTFVLVNDGDAELQLRVETEPLLGAGPPPDAWLRLGPHELTLAPGQTAEVAYEARVAPTQAGELSAMVIFTNDTPGLQVRYGSALYVGITGTEQAMARIDALTMHGGGPSMMARVQVSNQGNVHCRPEGRVTLADAAGVRSTGALPIGMPVLPGRDGAFTVGVTGGPFPAGAYRLEAALQCHAVGLPPVRLDASLTGQIADDGSWVSDDTAAAP